MMADVCQACALEAACCLSLLEMSLFGVVSTLLREHPAGMPAVGEQRCLLSISATCV